MLLRQHLLRCGAAVPGASAPLRVAAVGRCDGSVTQIVARGRAKLAYELELELSLELGAASASVALREVCDSDSDVFAALEVSKLAPAGEADAEALGAFLRKRGGEGEKLFRAAIRAWAAEAVAGGAPAGAGGAASPAAAGAGAQ